MFDHEGLNLAQKTMMLMRDILEWEEGLTIALEHGQGSHTFDDLVARILRGELHFYNYPECCLVMQIVQYPQFKNYHCFAAAGNQEALDNAGEDMQRMARQFGCKHLSISGRPGWVRRLKERGWFQASATMYLEL